MLNLKNIENTLINMIKDFNEEITIIKNKTSSTTKRLDLIVTIGNDIRRAVYRIQEYKEKEG